MPRRCRTVRAGDLRLWENANRLYVVLKIDPGDDDLVLVHIFDRNGARGNSARRSRFGISAVQLDPLVSRGDDTADA